MEAVILPVIGLMISLTLVILFYSKRHIHNKETELYSLLLMYSIIFILVGLSGFIMAKLTNNLLIIEIFQKIYMSVLVLINYYSIKYCFSLFNFKVKRLRFIKNFMLTITILTIALIFILPLQVIYYDNVLDGAGLSYDIALAYALFSFLIFIVLTCLLGIKKMPVIKIVPFLVLIVLYVIGFVLRSVYHELIFEGFFFSFILLIMYHTIENPDIKLIKELNLAKEQAEKSNRIKSEFLSSVSHEIRTPLNAIVGFSELITKAESLEEAKENSRELIDASYTLLNMISDVIDVAQVEVGDIEVTEVKYDLKEEVKKVCNLYKYRLEDKNLDLDVDIEVPKYLFGDVNKVKRIIASLLDNAIKYTQIGYVNLTITATVKNKKCYLEIVIKDTGIGITEEEQKFIFENFTRSEVNKNSDRLGMGLGLSLAKKIVEKLDGTITCTSKVGEGSTFVVKLVQKVSD